MKDSFSFFYSSRNSKKFHFPSFLFLFLFAVQYAAIDRIVLTFPPQRSLLGLMIPRGVRIPCSLQKAVNAIVLFSVLNADYDTLAAAHHVRLKRAGWETGKVEHKLAFGQGREGQFLRKRTISASGLCPWGTEIR